MAHHRRNQSRQQRDPPPSLFLHPSPAGSHVELPGILAPGAPVPGPSGGLSNERSLNPSSSSLSIHSANGPQRGPRSIESSRTADRTDALWAEMQATLQEVELSASGGTHVFGPEHDRKLNELRAAQIALAQAWARSEADEVIETAMQENMTATAGTADHHNLKTAFGDASKSAGEGTDAAKSTVQSNSARPMSRGEEVERLGAKLEEETEADILLARKRREANDQYFQQVNAGVLDVVARLEEVAVAMRAVEQESKDIWNDVELPSEAIKN
ncbi:unnamed protein product [Clonostachys rhizophaga]|uniref:Uncharacterized protein n=1 Tax=Clonostachys rhizophaga TaxID=160324 RepID=A0A9N9V8E6_9HYPO|nr:unnamed protein product [Clonostachys rhizophaga]